MRRAVMVAWLLGSLGATPLGAQEAAPPAAAPAGSPDGQLRPVSGAVLGSPIVTPPSEDGTIGEADEASPWQPVWGLLGLRAIPAGPKVAANGEVFHPNFSLDLNLNFWIWRRHGLYLLPTSGSGVRGARTA